MIRRHLWRGAWIFAALGVTASLNRELAPDGVNSPGRAGPDGELEEIINLSQLVASIGGMRFTSRHRTRSRAFSAAARRQGSPVEWRHVPPRLRMATTSALPARARGQPRRVPRASRSARGLVGR